MSIFVRGIFSGVASQIFAPVIFAVSRYNTNLNFILLKIGSCCVISEKDFIIQLRTMMTCRTPFHNFEAFFNQIFNSKNFVGRVVQICADFI